MNAPAFEVEGVVKCFSGPAGKPFRALDAVSLSAKGRLIAMIGPDGAGKSTLMRILCGLETPEAGTARVLGEAPDPENEALLKKIAYMPQTLGLYTDLSCIENLELFARLRGLAPEEFPVKLPGLLRMTGLAGFEARLAGRLSGGMKQKLALACALVVTPELLILDEPTVGVDPLSRRELWRVVDEMLAKTSLTCLFSTAYLEEAERADQVLFLEEGRLMADRTPSELIALARGRTFRAVPREGAPARLARTLMRRVTSVMPNAPWSDVVPQGGAVALLASKNARSPEAAGGAGWTVSERPPRLEDSYALLTFGDAGASREAEARAEPPAPADAPVLIEAKSLRRTFGAFVAVDETTFDVRKGEIFGLLGPNGAGKTTTFRMLCGLLKPSGGSVRVLGADLRTSLASVRSRIGYVAQRFSLYRNLTVTQNLRFFGRSYGLWGKGLRERIEAMLAEFGLESQAGRLASHLPTGAQRELSMACGLIHDPDILFLDEATSGADLEARRAFWRRIVALTEKGTTCVVTTHFMEEAEYCDRFLIQDQGKILAIGTPDEIRGRAPGSAQSIEEAFVAIVEAARRTP